MIKMTVLNERYYFNDKGEKIIPTDKEIREYYHLDDKITVVTAEFPNTGFGIANGHFGCYAFPYETREQANIKRNEMIQAEIKYYKNLVR